MWYTDNLSNLKNTEAYKALVKYSNSNNIGIIDIKEHKYTYPTYYTSGILVGDTPQVGTGIISPAYSITTIDIEKSIITFSKEITPYELINFFIVVNNKNILIYSKTSSTLSGKWIDPLHFKFDYKIPIGTVITSMRGNLSGEVNPVTFYNYCKGIVSNPVPTEWTRPIIVADLSQVFDTKTYDGSIAVYTIQASALNTWINNPSVIWCPLDELFFSSKISTNAEPEIKIEENKILKIKELSTNYYNNLNKLLTP
jgi:hypothetical protein